MAMTPQEMIIFFRDQAARSNAAARAAVLSSNYFLATLNIGEAFKCHLMEGLIAWRIGSDSPLVPIKDAVEGLREGARQLRLVTSKEPTEDIPVAQASIVSFLVDLPSPTLDLQQLESDRLLDGVLGLSLRDSWDQTVWEKGLAQLRKIKGASLAAETYSTYAQLRNMAGENPSELVRQAERLFGMRSRNAFYSGGPQTDGGGPDNEFTIDYRLAAILLKIGYVGDTIHRWRWR